MYGKRGGVHFLFFAHPATRTIRYPMTYGEPYGAQPATQHAFHFHVDGTQRTVELAFKPYQAVLLTVTPGEIAFRDIEFDPGSSRPPVHLGMDQ